MPRLTLTSQSAVTLTDIELVELVTARVADLLVKASAVADRSDFLPCADYWATRERLARIDDVLFSGQRFLQRLATV